MFRERGTDIEIHAPGSYLGEAVPTETLETFGYNTRIGRGDSWSTDMRDVDKQSSGKANAEALRKMEDELSRKPRTVSSLTEELGKDSGIENQITGVLVLDGMTESEAESGDQTHTKPE